MIKINKHLLLKMLLLLPASPLFAQSDGLRADFKNPPAKYRPIPFWHLNGVLTTKEINRQIADALKYGFGGVAVLPVTAGKQHPTGLPTPGMSPEYLSKAYFERYADILKAAKKNGGKVILYDDVDFPSGTAGGKLKELYPEATRKVLVKADTLVVGGKSIYLKILPGTLMAVVATNQSTQKRVDLTGAVQNGQLNWPAPAGTWKIQSFVCQPNGEPLVDYLDQSAVKKFIGLTYAEYYKRFEPYFGNTIQQTFFDDVGYYGAERGWTEFFNQKFKDRFGKDAAIYYPALWEDIGPETAAARVALFDTRAELLAEGFPKVVNAWDAVHHLKSSGHPPGNYEIQPVDMNFDIFKFYRHSDIPTMDAIFYHGHGREGYKLVSSAAAAYDRPVVAAEIFGAFLEPQFNIKTMYQTAMEVFARGVNQLIPHGMWFDADPKAVRIPPLISPYSQKIAPGLKEFNDWAARTSAMLTGGRTVVDIGVLYPITSLEAYYHFDAKGHEYGKYAPPGTDYLKISDLLTNNLHRDFSFIHPEMFIGGKYRVSNKEIVLDNKLNRQQYKVIILPAGQVLSTRVMQKLKAFFEQGGKVIATGTPPSLVSEFGQSAKTLSNDFKETVNLEDLIMTDDPPILATRNENGGISAYIKKVDSVKLAQVLKAVGVNPDVILENNTPADSETGKLSYLHKIKNRRDIYYIANSTTKPVNTPISLRGKMRVEWWDPKTGQTSAVKNAEYVKINGADYTRLKLNIEPVQAMFIVGTKIK